MDGGTLGALLIAVASLVGWAATQAHAMSRSQHEELRHRRRMDLGHTRYIHRLESELAVRDIPLPPKPDELLEAEKDLDW